jgi:hypothetical protein
MPPPSISKILWCDMVVPIMEISPPNPDMRALQSEAPEFVAIIIRLVRSWVAESEALVWISGIRKLARWQETMMW